MKEDERRRRRARRAVVAWDRRETPLTMACLNNDELSVQMLLKQPNIDINKTNRDFVEYRAQKLGVRNKLTFCKTIQETKISRFDTIVCLDVLEHLSDPAFHLDTFHKIMGPNSIGLFNWYFYKGENNEYPFHVDDEQIVEQFFKTLQLKFVEVFHPILITTRSYKKN